MMYHDGGYLLLTFGSGGSPVVLADWWEKVEISCMVDRSCGTAFVAESAKDIDRLTYIRSVL